MDNCTASIPSRIILILPEVNKYGFLLAYIIDLVQARLNFLSAFS